MIPSVSDIHTHRLDAGPDAVINLSPGQDAMMRPGGLYSVGIHPWDAAAATPATLAELERMAAMEQVVMVGECGVDRLRGSAPMERQLELLEAQARVAERVGKPLLLHVVRGFNEVMALHRRMRPSVEWIIHGFRGKPELARQLVAEGFYLSLGKRYNPASVAVIPAERLLHETDDEISQA